MKRELLNSDAISDGTVEQRPEGTKTAKRVKLERAEQEAHRGRSIMAKETFVDTQVQRNKLIAEQNLLALISMSAPPGDIVAAKILQLKKEQVLKTMQEENEVEFQL